MYKWLKQESENIFSKLKELYKGFQGMKLQAKQQRKNKMGKIENSAELTKILNKRKAHWNGRFWTEPKESTKCMQYHDTSLLNEFIGNKEADREF